MGGTVVRASVGSSSTICIVICPRLLRFQRRLVARSSSSIAPQFIIPVLSHPASLARISPLHSRSLPTRQSSVASLFPSLSFDSSSASLMSSRGAPALSSLLGTRLERLSPSGIRKRLENSLTGASCVKVSADIWSISQSRNWCRREGPSVGIMSGAMVNKGRRIDCYSSSQAGGGDQPTVASVLPPIPPVPKAKGLTISFCPRCGGATEEKIPVGEHELRFVCTACGAVHYQNPKMVVGCLVEHEEKVLLCRRNIEPSYGLWTLPAGYMEIGESAAEGAARETLEEACADVQVVGLFAHLDIPFIGQSYIIFRAQLKDLHFAPGPESLECALFKLDEIPFESLAFSSIYVALKMYVEDIKAGKVKVHHGVIQKRPGASPSDLQGFVVRDVLSS